MLDGQLPRQDRREVPANNNRNCNSIKACETQANRLDVSPLSRLSSLVDDDNSNNTDEVCSSPPIEN